MQRSGSHKRWTLGCGLYFFSFLFLTYSLLLLFLPTSLFLATVLLLPSFALGLSAHVKLGSGLNHGLSPWMTHCISISVVSPYFSPSSIFLFLFIVGKYFKLASYPLFSFLPKAICSPPPFTSLLVCSSWGDSLTPLISLPFTCCQHLTVLPLLPLHLSPSSSAFMCSSLPILLVDSLILHVALRNWSLHLDRLYSGWGVRLKSSSTLIISCL